MFYTNNVSDLLGPPTLYGRFIYIDAIPPHTPTTYRANMMPNPYVSNKFRGKTIENITTQSATSSPENQPSSQVTPPSNPPNHPGSPNNVPLLTQPEPFPLPTNNATNTNLQDIFLQEPLIDPNPIPTPLLGRSGSCAAGDDTTNSKTIDLLSKKEQEEEDKVGVSDVAIKTEEQDEEDPQVARRTSSTEAAATLVSIKDQHQNGLAVQSAVAPVQAIKPANSSDQNNKAANSSVQDGDKKMPAKGSLATDMKEKDPITKRCYRKSPSPKKDSHMQAEKVTIKVAMPKGVKKRLGQNLYDLDTDPAAAVSLRLSLTKQRKLKRKQADGDDAANNVLTKRPKLVVEDQCKYCRFPLSSCHDKAYGEYCTIAVVAEFDLCDHEEDLPTKMQSFYTFQRAYSGGAHYETFDLMKIYDENTTLLKPPPNA